MAATNIGRTNTSIHIGAFHREFGVLRRLPFQITGAKVGAQGHLHSERASFPLASVSRRSKKRRLQRITARVDALNKRGSIAGRDRQLSRANPPICGTGTCDHVSGTIKFLTERGVCSPEKAVLTGHRRSQFVSREAFTLLISGVEFIIKFLFLIIAFFRNYGRLSCSQTSLCRLGGSVSRHARARLDPFFSGPRELRETEKDGAG